MRRSWRYAARDSASESASRRSQLSCAPCLHAQALAQQREAHEGHMEKQLAITEGKTAKVRRKVADVLGVSERTAYRMLERHGLR